MNFGRSNNQPEQSSKPAGVAADGSAQIGTGRPIQAGAATTDTKPEQTAPHVGSAPKPAAGLTKAPAQKKPTEQESADQEFIGMRFEQSEVVEVLHYGEVPNAIHARMADGTTKHIPTEAIEKAKADREAHLAANPVKE